MQTKIEKNVSTGLWFGWIDAFKEIGVEVVTRDYQTIEQVEEKLRSVAVLLGVDDEYFTLTQ